MREPTDDELDHLDDVWRREELRCGPVAPELTSWLVLPALDEALDDIDPQYFDSVQVPGPRWSIEMKHMSGIFVDYPRRIWFSSMGVCR